MARRGMKTNMERRWTDSCKTIRLSVLHAAGSVTKCCPKQVGAGLDNSTKKLVQVGIPSMAVTCGVLEMASSGCSSKRW